MGERRVWSGGWWERTTATPHPVLAGLVRGPYVGWAEGTTAPMIRREVASTTIPLILNLGAPYRLRADGDASATVRGSFVAGIHRRPVLVESPVASLAMQCDLTPPGAFRLLGVPPGAFADATVDVAALLGAEGAALVARLGDAPDWPARFRLLDAFLVARCRAGPAATPRLAHAWALLRDAHGRIAPGALARATGWSHKQLIHRCVHDFGATPGALSRLLRFEHACTLATGDTAWSRIAASAGYADQSHLHRDFVRFAGLTPAAWRRAVVPDGGVLHPADPG